MNTKRLFILAGTLFFSLALVSTWFLFLSGAPVSTRAAGNTYTVCPAGPPTCGYSSVQSAVEAAGDGDVIKVATGTYTGVSDKGGHTQVVYVDKSVTIRGGYTTAFSEPPDPTANPTTLDAEGGGRVLFIMGDISPTIEGLRLTGGDATALGSDEEGGGVYVQSAAVTFTDNQVFGNTAANGGGFTLYDSASTLSHNTITSNDAQSSGGLWMWQCDNATLNDNIISYNTAISDTGGLRSLDGDNITLINNTIAHNSGDWSGGVDIRGDGVTLRGNTIISNTATTGGGLALSGSIELVGNEISHNTAVGGGGGAVVTGGTPTFVNNTISNNQAENGGGVQSFWSAPTFTGNIFSENSGMYGGGISLGDDNGTLSFNTFISNTATHQGGGLYLQGDHLINGNTISANSAVEGGGVFITQGGATLTNNLIYDNLASGPGFGSGINIGLGTPDLLHNTIAGNHGGSGGVWLADSTITMTNTIIVSHTVGVRVESNASVTLESTLWGTGAWANDTDWSGDGEIINVSDQWGDPDFIDPDAGDYHIGSNSDAIDTGVEAGVTSDIDNQPRPYQTPDAGADEYWPAGALKVIHLPLVIR